MKYEDYTVLPGGGFAFTNISRKFAVGDAYFINRSGLSAPTPGQYSNGFKVAPVLNALTARLGWIQPTQSGAFTLTGLNTTSNSSRFFNDGSFHAIVDPYIIQQVQPDNQITETNFNTLLLRMQQAAILRALNAVFNVRELLEKTMLFERFGRQDYLDTPSPGGNIFVGVRILPARNFDRAVQIDSVTLYFAQTVTFNLHLFHDTGPLTPIVTIPVTAIGGQQTVINFNQFVLKYADVNRSGYYYFGYFQNEVQGSAINEILERFNELLNIGCVPCELQVPYQGAMFGTPPALSINVNQVAFTNKTHGFNIQFSAFRDHTQAILDTPYLFDELIGLMVAAMTIEAIMTSLRSNKDERISKDLMGVIWKDLNLDESKGEGDFQPAVSGLKKQIRIELARVKKQFYPKQKVVTNTHDTESFSPYGMPEVDLFRY